MGTKKTKLGGQELYNRLLKLPDHYQALALSYISGYIECNPSEEVRAAFDEALERAVIFQEELLKEVQSC